MGGKEAVEHLLNLFRVAGVVGFSCGMIIAIAHSVWACRKKKVLFRVYFRGWWWRVPLAVLIIMLAALPLGTALLVFAVGIGMSDGASAGGGYRLVVPILLFAGISAVTAYLFLKQWHEQPNQSPEPMPLKRHGSS